MSTTDEAKRLLDTILFNALFDGTLETVIYMYKLGFFDKELVALPKAHDLAECIERHYHNQNLDQTAPVDASHATDEGKFTRYADGFARNKKWEEAVWCLCWAWDYRDRYSQASALSLARDMDALAEQCLNAQQPGNPSPSPMGATMIDVLLAAQTMQPDTEAAALALSLYEKQGDRKKLLEKVDQLIPRVEELCLWHPIIDVLIGAGATTKALMLAMQWRQAGNRFPAIYGFKKGRDSNAILAIAEELMAEKAKPLKILTCIEDALEADAPR